MYSPILNPGEEIIRTSPDVIVKNVLFDAFLTNKRIIFVKKTDDVYEKKELVFPINLVRKFDPKADQAGTPIIEFSIQKPSGDAGSLILKFAQTGDYRYFERDDWIEKLKRIASPGPVMQAQSPSFPPQERPLFNEPVRNTQAAADRFPGQPPASPNYSNSQYGTIPPVNPRQDSFAQPRERPPAAQKSPYDRQPDYPPQAPLQRMPPFAQPRDERMPPMPPQEMQMPPGQERGSAGEPSFCRYCNTKIPKGSLFCPACGQKTQNAALQNPGFSPPQPPHGGQRPPAPPVMPQARPRAQDTYAQRGPVRPPSGPQYVPPGGGISLADDPEYQSMQNRGRVKAPRPQGSQNNAEKNQQKAYKNAEKQRLKEQKAAQKAQRKAAKKGGRENYDPYAYKESRIPEGLPKIIGGIIAVVAVIAVILFAVNSGMFEGKGTTTPSGTTPSTASPTAQADYTPGITSVSKNYGTWQIQIIYSGQWSGSYTVNGVKTTITDDDGETEIYGYKQITLENPTGTISVTASKDNNGESLFLQQYEGEDIVTDSKDAEDSVLMVDIINQKGQYAASGSTDSSSDTVSVSAIVS